MSNTDDHRIAYALGTVIVALNILIGAEVAAPFARHAPALEMRAPIDAGIISVRFSPPVKTSSPQPALRASGEQKSLPNIKSPTL